MCGIGWLGWAAADDSGVPPHLSPGGGGGGGEPVLIVSIVTLLYMHLNARKEKLQHPFK